MSKIYRLFGSIMFVYFLGILSSVSVMEACGWLMGILALIMIWQQRTTKWPYYSIGVDWLLWPLTLVVLIGQILYADDLALGLERTGQMSWVLFLYLLVYAFHLKYPLEKYGNFFLTIILLISIYAISQFFTGIDLVRGVGQMDEYGGYYRSSGFFNSPMTYGHSFGMLWFLPLAILLVPDKNSPICPVLTFFTLLILGLSLLTTQTRGVWLGVFAGLLVVGLFRSRKTFWYFTLSSLIAVLTLFLTVPPFRARFSTLWDSNFFNNYQRIYLWKANWQMFLDHPLLGVGYWRNVDLLPDYYAKLGIDSSFYSHAHNTILHWLAGTGIAGLTLFMTFTIIIFVKTAKWWHILKPEQTWLKRIALWSIGAQVCLFVGGMTECNFEDAEVAIMYLTIIALTIVGWRQQATTNAPHPENASS